MDCPLCDLTKQEIIYQDGLCYATVIIEPLKKGHLMVLPIRHVSKLSELSQNESKAILRILDKLSKIISEEYHEDPIIFMNTGKHSTQSHIHFHILPSKGGLRDLFVEYEKVPYRKSADKEQLKQISKKIIAKLSSSE